MEGTSKNTGKPEKENQPVFDTRNEKIYRGTIIVLVLIIGALTFMLITSRQSLKDVTHEKEVTSVINEELQSELDAVLAEYQMVKLEYDSVLTDKDSIIQANAKEIERLIARQADYHRIRRQLNLLREVTQNYVHEIDSLYNENKVLKAENVQIREEMQRAQTRTTELTQDKEVLESKVEVASALRAHPIQADPIRLRGRHDREDETDRARRAEQIRVCFTIVENPIATPGNHNVYMRVAGPDDAILRLSDTDAYSFTHGQDTLQYSVKGTVNYQNRDTDVCLYWQRTAEFEPGVYLISLFTDEYRLGETSVTMR